MSDDETNGSVRVLTDWPAEWTAEQRQRADADAEDLAALVDSMFDEDASPEDLASLFERADAAVDTLHIDVAVRSDGVDVMVEPAEEAAPPSSAVFEDSATVVDPRDDDG